MPSTRASRAGGSVAVRPWVRTTSSRSNLGGRPPSGGSASHMARWCADVCACPPLFACVGTQLALTATATCQDWGMPPGCLSRDRGRKARSRPSPVRLRRLSPTSMDRTSSRHSRSSTPPRRATSRCPDPRMRTRCRRYTASGAEVHSGDPPRPSARPRRRSHR